LIMALTIKKGLFFSGHRSPGRWGRLAGLTLAAMLLLAVPAHAEKGDGNTSREVSFKKAPLFPKKGVWIQGKPRKSKFFEGKLTLVYFWDYTTVNCIRELSYLRDWQQVYEPYGLQVLMVHAPEFEFAQDKKHVADAVKRMKIPYPVYLDNDGTLWELYDNGSWPSKHLVDREGRIVFSQVGEGNYIPLEEEIRSQLQKLNPQASLPLSVVRSDQDRFNLWDCGEMSTEIYVGYKRAGWWGVEIANLPGARPDETVRFQEDGRRLERGFFLKGLWANREEYFEHADQIKDYSDYLGIIYLGHEVYGVFDQKQTGKASRVYIHRDDEPVPKAHRGEDVLEDETGDTYFIVDMPRLYYLIANEDQEFHELKLMPRDKDVNVYIFSFSNQCLTDFDHL